MVARVRRRVRVAICGLLGHRWSRYHWVEHELAVCERCGYFNEEVVIV